MVLKARIMAGGRVTEIGKGNKGGSTTVSWPGGANYMCVFQLWTLNKQNTYELYTFGKPVILQ